MRVYTVHLKHRDPGITNPDRNMVLVKEGFCWPALFASFLWATWHRMWAAAVILAVLYAGSGYAMGALRMGYDVSFLVHGLMGIALGFVANPLRRWHLARTGYQMVGGVRGDTMDDAEERYFHERGVPNAINDPATGSLA